MAAGLGAMEQALRATVTGVQGSENPYDKRTAYRARFFIQGGLRTEVCGQALELGWAEEIVLLAAGAVGALHAADEEDGHAHRDQNGENTFVDHKPMKHAVHTP